MYSIGEFAKLLGINSKTLRYYDLIGILKPSTVDKYTGYRSYSNNQIAEYKKIVYLKKIGFKYLTLGVEPNEIRNKQIYFHFGFTKYLKSSYETYPNGQKILVNYYKKEI